MYNLTKPRKANYQLATTRGMQSTMKQKQSIQIRLKILKKTGYSVKKKTNIATTLR
jgi:hypothetical protein